MDKQLLIRAFGELALEIMNGNDEWDAVIHKACAENKWFDVKSVKTSLSALATNYFEPNALESWLSQYSLSSNKVDKKLGLILAGNIPLVGIHDVIVGIFAGYNLKIKMSDKDKVLLPFLLERLDHHSINTLSHRIEIVDKLKDIDIVIATGTNNSAIHFEHYFSHIPHLIRKNRVSIAVLSGNENPDDLCRLGDDVFSYYGLGCRNVTKIYVPEEYDVTNILQAWDDKFDHFTDHNKYRNNYDYNLTMYIMNNVSVLANKQIILKEDDDLHSRIGVLNYSRYGQVEELRNTILSNKDQIQCVVCDNPIGDIDHVQFGYSQSPQLNDYADKIDTMAFLIDNY